MKVLLRAYINEGIGPPVEVEIERGHTVGHIRLTVTSDYDYDNIEINGFALWRAVSALMADPEKHGLKEDKLYA